MNNRRGDYRTLYSWAEDAFLSDYVEQFIWFVQRAAKKPIDPNDKISSRRFKKFEQAFNKQVDIY